MSTYFVTLITMLSFVFLFSTKTEKSRVVTIQKPMLITQERKTPAYFVYQQSLALTAKKELLTNQKSTFLSNQNFQHQTDKINLAEMKFTRQEYAQLELQRVKARTVASELNTDMANLAYEKVIFNQQTDIPLREAEEDVPALSPSKKWASIKGKFELTEGVGIVDHIIDIKRVEEGQVKEHGRINLQAGSYSIDIESPNGFIVAQVRDKSGFIVGEDRQRIINLHNKGSFFEGPFIRVGRPDTIAANPNFGKTGSSSPAANSIASVKTKSSETPTANTNVANNLATTIFDNQKTLASPADEFGNISKYSSTIARLYDPSQIYADIVTIRMTGEKSTTELFTKKWIDSVVSQVSEIQQLSLMSKEAPLLIGRVMVDGKPAIGAQVMIESLPSAKVFYLDQFMNASSQLNETSANGYFVYVGLDEGTYDVAVVLNNKIVGSQIFMAEKNSVGFQNILTKNIPQPLIVRSFDAFTNELVETDIVVTAQEETIQTNTASAIIQNYVENNVTEFLVRTSDSIYIPMRYTQSGLKDYAHLPMIQEAWLNEIKKLKMIDDSSNAGIIIGFTPQIKYSAYLVLDGYSNDNVVYFTADGQLSPEPVLGGGFILFNVPVGAREVVLQEIETEKVFTQIFNIKYQQVSVSHFSE